jgi:hypothetical protein
MTAVLDLPPTPQDMWVSVTLRSSAGQISLWLGEDRKGYKLLDGMRGVGVAPLGLETAPAGRHGSVLLSNRMEEVEIGLPIAINAPSPQEVHDLRQRMNNLLMPGDEEPVEIIVHTPHTGGYRTRYGHITSGLEGAWGKSDSHRTWYHTVLVFQCPDVWAYGQERVREWSLSTTIKPYWTSYPRLPHYPAWLSSSTVLGEFEFTVSGDSPASPVWTIYPPGEDLLIRCGNGCGKELFFQGEIPAPLTIDTRSGEITCPGMTRREIWERIPEGRDRMFDLPPGENKVEISMVKATASSRARLAYREKWKAQH